MTFSASGIQRRVQDCNYLNAIHPDVDMTHKERKQFQCTLFIFSEITYEE